MRSVREFAPQSMFLLFEFYLPRFSLGVFDGQCDRRARRYRTLCVSLQRIIALRREGKRLAATAANDEHRSHIALGRDRLRVVRLKDVDRNGIARCQKFGVDAGDVQHQAPVRPFLIFLGKSRRSHRESRENCQYESHDRSPWLASTAAATFARVSRLNSTKRAGKITKMIMD